MRSLYFLVLALLICIASAARLKTLFNSKVRSAVAGSLFFLSSNSINVNVANAGGISSENIKAVEVVIRVTNSLKYIEEDIANKGDPKDVLKQIKFLVNNYKLKDNVALALSTVVTNKVDAKLHGTNAVEDLAQVFEYFADEIDNMSGNVLPPKDILMFADQATRAAEKELKLFLQSIPSDITDDVNQKLASEISG